MRPQLLRLSASPTSMVTDFFSSTCYSTLKNQPFDCDSYEFEYVTLISGQGVHQSDQFIIWITEKVIEQVDPQDLLLQLKLSGSAFDCSFDLPLFEDAQVYRVGLACDSHRVRKLYFHLKENTTQRNLYRCLNLENGNWDSYSFYFLPESPCGIRPQDIIGTAHPLLQLLTLPRVQASSGFWIRRDSNGQINQFDFSFPWYPLLAELPPLLDYAKANLSEPELDQLRSQRCRNLGVSLNSEFGLKSYTSAEIEEWPRSLDELVDQVRKSAEDTGLNCADIILPVETTDADPRIGQFYDGPIEAWQKILGKGMHYHAGFFPAAGALSPQQEEMGWEEAVTSLYPFLKPKTRLYDIGCGWGGPLQMLCRDLQISGLGVTASRQQYQFVYERGLDVRFADCEATLPPGHFDCLWLLESLSHINQKQLFLKMLRPFGDRLIMRVNCQDNSPESVQFGGSMHMIHSASLYRMIDAAGWKIVHWRDRRMEAIRSIEVWHRKLKGLEETGDPQIECLRSWLEMLIQSPDAWGRNNPLIEVVAE